MKSFRSMFPILGVIAVLAGCSGAESTNTGVAANAISATDTPSGEGRGGPHAGHARRFGGGPDFLVFAALHEDIGLSADQRSTIEGLVAKPKTKEARPERPAPDKAKIAELAAAIRAGNLDGSKLGGASPNRDGANLMAERQAKSAEKLTTLHDTLTAAQRSALVDAIVAKKGQHAKGAKGERREGRPEGREGRQARQARQGREGGPMGHLFADLDLTQAQKDELEAKLEANRPARPSEEDRAAMKATMKAAMEAKLQSFKGDAFDAKAFVARPANAPEMKIGRDRMAKGLSAIVSVLTAEQREKLAQKIEQGPRARK